MESLALVEKLAPVRNLELLRDLLQWLALVKSLAAIED